MAVIVENNEIWLTGYVGEDYWYDGFTAGGVVSALAQVGRSTDIIVHLNSGGGLATEGAAIHAQLSAHKGNVEIIVEGIAASAASVIAMAADHLVMSVGSVFMIHDPIGMTWGNVADHQKSIETLDSIGNAYADVYAEKTGRPVAEMRDLMRAETWMTADEAVAAGFADETTSAAAKAANDNEPTAFSYRAYAHAPERLVALADAKGWTRRPHSVAAPAASQQEPTMPNPANPTAPAPTATTVAAPPAPAAPQASTPADPVKARIKAILDAPAATGREALARHFAFDTDMTAEAAVAALAVATAAPSATPPQSASPEAYAEQRAAAAALAQPSPRPQASAPQAVDSRAIYARRAEARAGRR
jgi:ATP-dependent protease ClpP protease subunit